jgi:hypothetical protein
MRARIAALGSDGGVKLAQTDAVDIVDDEPRPLGRETQRGCAADAAGSAGHERDLVRQAHGSVPLQAPVVFRKTE